MSPSRWQSLDVSALLLLLLAAAAPGALSQAHNLCATKANGRYFCADCSTSAATSDRGADFEANLLRLRDALKAMAAGTASFLNATFGQPRGRGDVRLRRLPRRGGGRAARDAMSMVLWYPQCVVRYDNASFFGAADTSPARRFDVPNPNNFSDPAALREARGRLGGRRGAGHRRQRHHHHHHHDAAQRRPWRGSGSAADLGLTHSAYSYSTVYGVQESKATEYSAVSQRRETSLVVASSRWSPLIQIICIRCLTFWLPKR